MLKSTYRNGTDKEVWTVPREIKPLCHSFDIEIIWTSLTFAWNTGWFKMQSFSRLIPKLEQDTISREPSPALSEPGLVVDEVDHEETVEEDQEQEPLDLNGSSSPGHPRVIIEPSRIITPKMEVMEFRGCEIIRSNMEPRIHRIEMNKRIDHPPQYRETKPNLEELLRYREINSKDEIIHKRFQDTNGCMEEREQVIFRDASGCYEEQQRLREQQRAAIELCRPGLQVVALPPEEFRQPALPPPPPPPPPPLVSSTSPGVITHCPMRPPPPPPPKLSRHNIERSVPYEEPSSSIPDLGERLNYNLAYVFCSTAARIYNTICLLPVGNNVIPRWAVSINTINFNFDFVFSNERINVHLRSGN